MGQKLEQMDSSFVVLLEVLEKDKTSIYFVQSPEGFGYDYAVDSAVNWARALGTHYKIGGVIKTNNAISSDWEVSMGSSPVTIRTSLH